MDQNISYCISLNLLPTRRRGGGGGGGLFGAYRQTGSQNSGTLSPRVSKFLTSLLCLLDTLWRNLKSIDLPGELLQSFFEH